MGAVKRLRVLGLLIFDFSGWAVNGAEWVVAEQALFKPPYAFQIPFDVVARLGMIADGYWRYTV